MIDKEHKGVHSWHDKTIAKIVHTESTMTGHRCHKDHAWFMRDHASKKMMSQILGYLTKLIIRGHNNSNIQDNLLLENTKTNPSATLSSLQSTPDTTLLLVVICIGIRYTYVALV
ncbi:hypothetical protein K0M31_001971 [Melipona bicolor]|uniref:Uncharacterized protein n=1 Tax=Melipona bicolor TaxID=60889 RepID=A0AA40KYQ8_9HYME|nr:hypothetical protein K0M31_001971 [Melipona bicolor]